MKISGRIVSLQLDGTGAKVLNDAGIEPEQALAAFIVDEDERGLWSEWTGQAVVTGC